MIGTAPHFKRFEVEAPKPSHVGIYAPSSIADELAQRLRDDGDIDFPDPAALSWGMSRRRVTHEDLARTLISWADQEGPKSALAKLRQLGINAATETVVVLVSGVTVTETIKINASITLCSLSSIPVSRGKLLAIDLLKGPAPAINEDGMPA